MIYSCFDAPSGLYRYFEDDRQHPLNGDLPVPKFSDDQTSQVGVAAVLAARPFPEGARFIGTGWNARGIVVSCEKRGHKALAGLTDPSTWPSWWPWAAGAAAGALAFWLWRQR